MIELEFAMVHLEVRGVLFSPASARMTYLNN